MAGFYKYAAPLALGNAASEQYQEPFMPSCFLYLYVSGGGVGVGLLLSNREPRKTRTPELETV
jgi:hypothetical protein